MTDMDRGDALKVRVARDEMTIVDEIPESSWAEFFVDAFEAEDFVDSMPADAERYVRKWAERFQLASTTIEAQREELEFLLDNLVLRGGFPEHLWHRVELRVDVQRPTEIFGEADGLTPEEIAAVCPRAMMLGRSSDLFRLPFVEAKGTFPSYCVIECEEREFKYEDPVSGEPDSLWVWVAKRQIRPARPVRARRMRA